MGEILFFNLKKAITGTDLSHGHSSTLIVTINVKKHDVLFSNKPKNCNS